MAKCVLEKLNMKCSAVKLKSDSIELNMSLFQSLLKYVALSKSK